MATGILEVVPAIAAWELAHLKKDTVPHFTWTIDKTTGEITATLNEHGIVHEANVWWAYSCGNNAFDGKMRRDYRVAHLDNPCSCGLYAEGYCSNFKAFWHKETLQATTVNGRRTYSAKLEAPSDGRYVAFMIDIKYINPNAFHMDPLKMVNNMKSYSHEEKRPHIMDKFGFDFGGFPHDFGKFFEFTTEVSVFPDTFPYEDCQGTACGSVPMV